MNIHPQFIKEKEKPSFVILSFDEYKKILEALEDLEDIQACLAAENDNSESFPFDLVKRIADGENTIKAYREYRKISQNALAKKLKVSRQYISQIEAGERKGTATLLKRIAKILKVDLDDLVR